MKVAICTPHSNVVSPAYYRHVLNMQNSWKDVEFIHIEIEMEIVGKARNELVRAALGQNCDVLWFIDNDVLVPPHAGLLVKRAKDLGVVSGLYWNRRPPYTPQLYELAKEPEHKGMYWPMVQYPEKDLFDVDAVGAGCLAIRADIFKNLEDLFAKDAEWRKRILDEVELDDWKKEIFQKWPELSPWFEFTDRKGEDLYFCENVKRMGFKVWVDPQVKCGHLGYIPIEEHHFKFLMDRGLIRKVGDKYETAASEPA